VRNNSFTDIPSSAIRVEACDALIEMNYFYRCVYESGDQGAIDMWANPLYRGNIIRWNDFDRIVNNGSHYGTAAVRHDNFISGFMVNENVFRKGSNRGFGSVQYNQGTDNYFEGNVIIDWHKAFTGGAAKGNTWKSGILTFGVSKQVVQQAPWRSDAWRQKYPMVRDLFNGNDNCNFLVGNRRFGSGLWGDNKVSFANIEGDNNFHGESLDSVKPYLVPWYPIPIDRIGPYEQNKGGK
jgi:hypothetical protein